jgi:hypothetical protein
MPWDLGGDILGILEMQARAYGKYWKPKRASFVARSKRNNEAKGGTEVCF